MLRRLCRLPWLSRLTGNPLKSARGDEAHDQEVLLTEAGGIFPSIPISIGSLKGDVKHRAFVSFLPPDARTHGTMADSLDRL